MMENPSLLSLSPLDGRYRDKLSELSEIFSEYGLIKFRCTVEIKWLQCLAAHKDIPEVAPLTKAQEQMLDGWIDDFSITQADEVKKIEKETVHDVKALELWLAARCKQHGLADYCSFIHFGCTSEDINNLAYGLMIQHGKQLLLKRLSHLIDHLKSQAAAASHIPMLARTHGQPASPTTLGKEWAVYAYRLLRQHKQLAASEVLAKFNGATGNYHAVQLAYPNIDWQQTNRTFVESLGLQWNPYTTQIESHDYIAEVLHCIVRANSVVIDMCRDLWGYIALGYFHQLTGDKQVGSSTMPHKINPINFENAEGNLSFAGSQASYLAGRLPLSRWQRDLTDSTLMRNLGVVLGHSLLGYESCLKGLTSLIVAEEAIAADLNHRWELLAEPLQTLLRQAGQQDAYQHIRKWSQGKNLNHEDYCKMVNQTNLSKQTKDYMLSLRVQDYIGLAANLATNITKIKL